MLNLRKKEWKFNEDVQQQVTFTALNAGSGPGVLQVGCYSADNDVRERYVILQPNEAKEIGMVLPWNSRYSVGFNTYISQNIPSNFIMDARHKGACRKEELFEGERAVDNPLLKHEPGVVIVDNIDSGFSILSQPKEALLTRIIKRRLETADERPQIFHARNPVYPPRWTRGIDRSFYGIVEKSAYYIQSGKGEAKAQWIADIPEEGRYEVWYNKIDIFGRNGVMNYRYAAEFNFLVYHDDGVQEVAIDETGRANRWMSLGVYHFSKGPARVVLTDKTTGKMVFADAVKWVKQ